MQTDGSGTEVMDERSETEVEMKFSEAEAEAEGELCQTEWGRSSRRPR